MFVCLFVCWPVFFILIILEHSQEYTLKILWRSILIWLIYIGFLKMFICVFFVGLFIDLFFVQILVGHPQDVSLKVFWISNFIWLRYLGSKKMFIRLFVCLFVYWLVFYFNHIGTPTEIYPENFVKIRLDLAEIFKI